MSNTIRSTSILALTLTLFGFTTTSAFAASTALYASGWVSSGTDWTPSSGPNPLNMPDSNCVGTSNGGTVYAQFEFPSFGIPGGDSIDGIEVHVNYGSVVESTLQLYMSGSPIGDSRALGLTPPTGSCNDSVLRSAGGASDDWGAALTAADFNTAGSVQVRLSRTTGGDMPRSIDIESIQLVVHHSDGANQPPVAQCQDIIVSADASCQATVTAAEVDNGSNDPDGDQLSFSLNPAGPYALGDNIVTLSVSDGVNPPATCEATITVEDNTAPVISLNGGDQTLECALETYSESGATVTDNCDAPTVNIGGDSVDESTPGVYIITYDAADNAGNNATQVTRTVTVQDTIAPVISLNGDNPLILECAVDIYVDPGTTVAEDCGISTPVAVGGDAVDVGTPGDYNVTYDATDDAGNVAIQVARTVTVEDTLPPVIACNIPNPATIIPPDAPISFTATADDACEGMLTAAIDSYDCFWTNPSGKLVDKTNSCVVSFSGDTLTIDDSGGVKDTIEWSVTAADSVPNEATETCSVEVVKPNGKKP